MGLFVMGQGLYPLGSLLAGSLASLWGVRAAVLCFSVMAAAAALVYRTSLRRAPSAGVGPAP